MVVKTIICSGVARGGAARPGCHHFGVTPFSNVFVMKTFSFNLLGLNPHTQRQPTEFLAKTFFFGLHVLLNRKPTKFLAKAFFSFWFSLTEGWHQGRAKAAPNPPVHRRSQGGGQGARALQLKCCS